MSTTSGGPADEEAQDREQAQAISNAIDEVESGFDPLYDLEVGTVEVTDEHSGDTITMWKARGDGKEGVSPDMVDAVMQCIQKIRGVRVSHGETPSRSDSSAKNRGVSR